MKQKRSVVEIISTMRFLHILLAILIGFLIGAGFLAIMGIVALGCGFYAGLLNSQYRGEPEEDAG